MGKFERTRYILIACLDILLEEKQLLLFPLVSLACTGLVLLSFLPMWDPVVWEKSDAEWQRARALQEQHMQRMAASRELAPSAKRIGVSSQENAK